MAGRFMDKETVEAEATRLGVDLTGLTWPKKQQAVMAAQRAEKEAIRAQDEPDEEEDDLFAGPREMTEDEIRKLFGEGLCHRKEPKTTETAEVEGEVVHIHVVNDDPMAPMRGETLLIAPEMADTANQLFGYEEELDEGLVVEEVFFDTDSAYKAGKDLVTGTYTVSDKTGKKVIAHTALPKQNAGITYDPERDWVPVVTYRGRKGYLWTHHRLPNIKDMLLKSGYYEDYRKRFQDEPFVWHAAGKLLCCDISLAESVLRDIERRARENQMRQRQNDEFIRQQMTS